MSELRQKIKKLTELEEAILREKEKGTPDIEIGKTYNVTFRFIEKLVTKSQGINVSQINRKKTIKSLAPKDFKLESTSVWSFKSRGNWATHSGEYRGNWSPYIPRNIILRYSKPGDIVLDNFCGAGTTAVECKLLGRRCIAIDINERAIELAKKNLNFEIKSEQLNLFSNDFDFSTYEPQLIIGDARDLSFIENNSIDLICSHPPYANIIQYTDKKDGDLSILNMREFLTEMIRVAEESYRVLKPGKKCAVLIGDTRKNKRIVPLGFNLLDVYLGVGFVLKEIIIKRQHNCKTTGFWYTNSIKHNFLLLAHEYLFVLEKPETNFHKKLKEDRFFYSFIKVDKGKFVAKKKLQELETTSVWIFKDEDFEKNLLKNIIERYSKDKNFQIIDLKNISTEKINNDSEPKINKSKLLIIKSQTLFNENFDIYNYVHTIEKVINSNIDSVDSQGFIVIQAKDYRTNNELFPTAKVLLDVMSKFDLTLKEIIIVTKENKLEKCFNYSEEIKIIHQYLLVFENRH